MCTYVTILCLMAKWDDHKIHMWGEWVIYSLSRLFKNNYIATITHSLKLDFANITSWPCMALSCPQHSSCDFLTTSLTLFLKANLSFLHITAASIFAGDSSLGSDSMLITDIIIDSTPRIGLQRSSAVSWVIVKGGEYRAAKKWNWNTQLQWRGVQDLEGEIKPK